MMKDFYYKVTVALLESLRLTVCLHWKHSNFLESPINKYMTLCEREIRRG